MLMLAGKASSIEDGKNKIIEAIHSGKAYAKFLELVQSQGGDISYIENTDKFEKAKYVIPIEARKDGTITKLDAYEIGRLSCYLGAGRQRKEESINPRVGFVFEKKVGDKVKYKDVIGYIHADDEKKAYEVKEQLEHDIIIG